MDCFAIHLFFPSSNRHEAEKGCREQVPCWDMGRHPHHSPSMDCIAIHLLSPLFKPPRSGDGSLRDNRPSGGAWGGSPITPPRWIASHSICSPPSLNRREAEKGCREQCSLLGYGAKPHRSPPSPSSSPPSLDAYLSPFHHRRTRSARKRIKLPVRHMLDSVVRLHRTRRRRSRRRYAVAMRRRHAPA